ncbi:MAG: MarR family transcriptional regulator [Alphaproteobacteria bacterium]|nr:MarR family transcriptional regulator [Alphaproteobacteria bacterium]
MKKAQSLEEPRINVFDSQLLFLLMRANLTVTNAFAAKLNHSGLTDSSWRVLATLSEIDGIIVTHLAEVTMLKQPTLTKLLDRMVKLGYVVRKGNDKDRRKIEIHLTSKGRAISTELLKLSQTFEQEMMPREEVLALKEQLQNVIDLRWSSRDMLTRRLK